MSLPKKKIISFPEALELLKEHCEKNGKPEPKRGNLYKYIYAYEGLLCYKTAQNSWRIYEDVLLYYLENGFPDLSIQKPVMELSVALRYLHKCGIDPKYTLREFRRDAKELGMVFYPKLDSQSKKPRQHITRSNCNKFLGIWNGNR